MWADPQSSGCNPREKPIMTNNTCPRVRPFFTFRLTLVLGVLMSAPLALMAQGPGTEDGLWTFLGGDAWHTRYQPADQINASNFEDLEIAWRFNAMSFGPATPRATGSLVDGKLITVTGERRSVIALDAGTGELEWSYTEPKTARWEYSSASRMPST